MKPGISATPLALVLMGVLAPGGAAHEAFYDVQSTSYDAGQTVYGELPYDSVEARVWLDRGDEPVVERGDEIRVYYRTSHDAYAAIFRIDTDGRIDLVFPQHPDADPFVAGGRDYRLIFRDAPRWRVRDDPGVGYYFMIASQDPLDFSLFGWDDDDGWDLSGVGESVYTDPYVAIDDYVAAVLPTWESSPYALDFLEYAVDEDHSYPRFLCYDCHGFQSYARWDPYSVVCSSYQVVVWDDPYFYPRFRYVGTRVVFGRPIGPRPRYGVTARIVGSSRGPIFRSRPAPPRRTAAFKEAPQTRRTLAPDRRSGAGVASPRPTAPRAAPAPGRGTRPTVGGRPSGRLLPPAVRGEGRGRPGVGTPDRVRRPDPAPSARSGTRPPAADRSRPQAGPGRALPRARSAPARAGPRSGAVQPRERPTLQRRPPASGGTRPRATPSPRARPGSGARGSTPPRSAPRAAPPRASAPRAAPRSAPPRSAPPRAAPRRRPPGGEARPPRSSPPSSASRPPRSGGGDRARRPPPPPRRPGG